MTDGGDSAVLDGGEIDALMLATVKSSAGKHADGRSEVLNTLLLLPTQTEYLCNKVCIIQTKFSV